MALRALMLKKRLDDKRKELEDLKTIDFAQREAELEKAIEETTTDEERSFVDSEIEKFEAEKTAHDASVRELEKEVENLERELSEIEDANNAQPEEGQSEPAEEKAKEKAERSIVMPNTIRRTGLYAISEQERSALLRNDEVKTFLARARECIKEKRALTNVGLTIPDVMLPLLRQIVEANSKLASRVNLQRVGGKARQNIMGTIPEGVWTEMCATLNELSLGFNNIEVDGYKVGGYFAVCNAVIEDSDLNLANELLNAIGVSIAKALDKAIIYGTGTKMPLGIVTRLAQTAAPAGYPSTARTWVDLHTSNVKTGTGATGLNLFKELVGNTKVIINDYFSDDLIWIMNKKTHVDLLVNSMDENLNASIVAGIGGEMPVIGGETIELPFIPDGNIVCGYGSAYLLAERAGTKLGQSEHYRFVEDQTIFKGTARYDGAPVIAEAFVVMSITTTAPTTSGITFAADAANTPAQSGSSS